MSKRTEKMGLALASDLHEFSKHILNRHAPILNVSFDRTIQMLDNYGNSNVEEKLEILKPFEKRLDMYVDACKAEFKGYKFFVKSAEGAINAKKPLRDDLLNAAEMIRNCPAVTAGNVKRITIDYARASDEDLIKALKEMLQDRPDSIKGYYEDRTPNGFVTQAELAQENLGNLRQFIGMLTREV